MLGVGQIGCRWWSIFNADDNNLSRATGILHSQGYPRYYEARFARIGNVTGKTTKSLIKKAVPPEGNRDCPVSDGRFILSPVKTASIRDGIPSEISAKHPELTAAPFATAEGSGIYPVFHERL